MLAIPRKPTNKISLELRKGEKIMTKSNNKINVPEARAAMDKFKMEAASEVGVNLKEGYNGDLTSREAGSVGGQMVKKMIESYEKSL
jgi:small acid-soluble spore protein D (minor alpha/beta-type SASP)